jgi:hypothetical protein
MIVQPGSFRTGIEKRTKFSGAVIDDYAATAGAFRGIVQNLAPDMFPGDPVRAAQAIWTAVKSDSPPHWLVLGTDALRRIDAKLQSYGSELDRARTIASTTDLPDAGPPLL